MVNEWYKALQRPTFTPPDWVFGPAWTILYLMIALAIYLYLRGGKDRVRYLVLLLLAAHLLANGIWTTIFFRFKSPGWALVDILFLDISLVVLVFAFWKRRKLASILLIPYLGWVLFATYLNAGFYLLNRAQQ
jgi:translocator protein